MSSLLQEWNPAAMQLVVIHLIVAAYAFWECWQGARRLRRELVRTILFGGIGLINGLVPAIGDPWHERTIDPYSIHLDAARFVLAGTLLLGLGWRFYDWMFPHRGTAPCLQYAQNPLVQNRLRVMMYLCAVGGIVAWVGSQLASGASLTSLLSARRLEFRGQGYGVLVGLFNQLFCVAYLPGFLGPQLKGRDKLFGILYAIFLAVALFLLSRGTRAGAIGILGSLMVGLIYANRVSLEKLFFAGVGISLVALLAVAMLPLRHQMSTMDYSDMAAFLVSHEAYADALSRDPLNYHDHFVQIRGIFPDSEPYVDAATYRRILFFYLPGDKFPWLKPRDADRIVALALFGDRALEIDWMHPPGIFGDVYLNFWGWKGIGFFFLEGMFLAWVTRAILSRSLFYLGLAPQTFFLCLLGIRGQPYAIATAMIITLLVTWGIMQVASVPRLIQNGKRPSRTGRVVRRPVNIQAAA